MSQFDSSNGNILRVVDAKEKEKTIIWGASGHAKVVADIIHLQGIYDIEGFIDDVNLERAGTDFLNAKVLGGAEVLPALLDAGSKNIILAFGNCQARLKVADQVREMGFELISAVHPGSIIASDVVIRPGTVVAAGAVINPACSIGENVIINTASSVDHDCAISDGVHICPGVHLSGKVHVGKGSWIGVGSCVIDGISIGKFSFLGAGSTVVKDIPDGVLAYGNPATVVKEIAIPQ